MASFVVQVVVGWTLLSSGLMKFRSTGFVRAVANYRLIPPRFVVPVATTIPWLETAVGVALLLGPWPRLSLTAAATLLTAFALAVAINLVRGEQIPCGCRGTDTPISWHLVASNLGLATASVYIAVTAPASVMRAATGQAQGLTFEDAVALLLALLMGVLCLRLLTVWHQASLSKLFLNACASVDEGVQ